MNRKYIIITLVFTLACMAINAYSSLEIYHGKLISVNDSVSLDSAKVVNDSTVAVADSLKTDSTDEKSAKSKMREPRLTVQFTLKDFLTHEAVDSAVSLVLNAADSSFVDSAYYFCYDNNGKYSGIYTSFRKAGKFLFYIRANGYRTIYVPFDLPKLHKRESWRELKPVYMHKLPKEREIILNEVEVKATKLQFYMDGDTMVYDADAFNLTEGSMLDELIRRLPGASLSRDGEISVNGRKIDALLLNGKDFFDSDRNMILENMPSYMVDKVQAYERVSDRVKGTSRENSERKELVMNVRLKKEYNGGWIANAEGGVGTPYKDNWSGKRDTKFLGRFLALHFNDKARFSLFANANNLNDYRDPGRENGEWSPLRQSEGLKTIYKVGMNGMYEFEEDCRYQGSVTASKTDTENERNGNSTNFLLKTVKDEDGNDLSVRDTRYRKNYSRNLSKNIDVESNHSIQWRSKNLLPIGIKHPYLSLNTRVYYRNWDNRSNSASVTLAEDVASELGKSWLDSIMSPVYGSLIKKYAINRSLSSSLGTGRLISAYTYGWASASPNYNDNISFSLNVNHSYSNNKSDSYSQTRYDYPKSGDESVIQNRFTPNSSINQNGSVSLSTHFSLGKGHRIGVGDDLNFDYEKSDSYLYMLQKLSGWDDYDAHPIGALPSTEDMLKALDIDNSNETTASSITHCPKVEYGYTHYNQKTGMQSSLDIAVEVPMLYESYKYWQGSKADTTIRRNFTYVKPSINYWRSNFKEGESLAVSASMTVSAPELSYFIDAHDTSNPMYETRFNPNLKNTTEFSMSSNYSTKFGRTQFNSSLRSVVTLNSVGYSSVVDSNNRTVSTPMNINGNWTLDADLGVQAPLGKDDTWRLDGSLNYNFRNSVDFTGTDSLDIHHMVAKNHNTTGKLGLAYRPNAKMSFGAKGSLDWQLTSSNNAAIENINAFTFNYGLTAQVELPWNMQFATDLTMYSRRGYSDESMNTNELVWNARLSKRMMKGNLIVQLDGFDMLGNLKNVRRYVTASGRTETFYNVIPSYCLLHAIWRLNKQPKKKNTSK